MQVKPRPYRLPGLLGSRITNHETRLFLESRLFGFSRVTKHGFPVRSNRRCGARGATPGTAGRGVEPLLNQCFPALCFQFFAANCCAQVQMRGTGKCTGLSTVNLLGGPCDERRSLGNPCRSARNPVCPRKMREAQPSPPSGPFALAPTKMNPCRERGTFCIALTVRSRLIDTSSIAVIPLRFSFRASARRCLFEQASGPAQDGRRQEA